MSVGWDDLLGVPTMGLYNGVKAATGGYAAGGTSPVDALGNAIDDYSRVGKNNFQATPLNQPTPQYGGYEGGADDWSNIGLGRMGSAGAGGAYAQGQMMKDRGDQATENQELSDRESEARYGDQNGAIQLAREGAMGLAPSQAAYQMQAGLDSAINSQEAQKAGARSNAGLALAGANAAGNTANLQNQAFTGASALRAKEMQDYTGMYGGLAGQQRQQDQSRLQQGSQMGQFNAGLNDQYKMGMGGLANQYGQQGQGWYTGAMQPQNQQMAGQLQTNEINSGNYNQAQSLNAGRSSEEANRQQQNKDRYTGMVLNQVNNAGQMGVGASKIPPKA